MSTNVSTYTIMLAYAEGYRDENQRLRDIYLASMDHETIVRRIEALENYTDIARCAVKYLRSTND